MDNQEDNEVRQWTSPLPPPAPAPLTPFISSKSRDSEEAEQIVNVVKSGLEPESIIFPPPPVASKTEEEEVHRATRLNPDTPKVLALAIFLVFVLMVSSFIVSFFGIWGVSRETTNLPGPITWLPALFLDAAILAYTISYFVFQARSEPVIKTRFALWTFALLSVAANVAHTVDGITPEMSPYSVAIGILITGSAPIAVVLSTEEIARLAFQRVKKKPN
jgi:hypothetical protein